MALNAGRLPLALLLGCLAWLTGPPLATAHGLTPEQQREVGFDQRLGQAVPPELTFRDEAGRARSIGSFLGDGPVVVTMNYLHCKNLCPLLLESLAGTLHDLPFALGDRFTVLTVSLDPRETPELAAQRQAELLRIYGRPGGERGWRLLTGDHETIDRLADALGLRYAYDPDQDEYAHPAGLVVLTPGGQISRYLFGLDLPVNDLRLALVDAGQRQIGGLVEQVLLLCYHYDPSVGRYTETVLGVVRSAGVATVVGLAVFLGGLWRRDLVRGGRPAGKVGG